MDSDIYLRELSELNDAIGLIQVSGLCMSECVRSYSLSFTLTMTLSAMIWRMSTLT